MNDADLAAWFRRFVSEMETNKRDTEKIGSIWLLDGAEYIAMFRAIADGREPDCMTLAEVNRRSDSLVAGIRKGATISLGFPTREKK